MNDKNLEERERLWRKARYAYLVFALFLLAVLIFSVIAAVARLGEVLS